MDIENFIKICNESISMREASKSLNIPFSTFRRLAVKYNCYNTNMAGKGINKKRPKTCTTDDILDGKHPNFQTYKLKKRLIKDGILENKCYTCGINE